MTETIFREFDSDRDGQLSHTELQALLRPGPNPNPSPNPNAKPKPTPNPEPNRNNRELQALLRPSPSPNPEPKPKPKPNPTPKPKPNPSPNPNHHALQALLEMQIATKPTMKDGTPYRGTEQMCDHIPPPCPLDLH
jgi:hypothetical protein